MAKLLYIHMLGYPAQWGQIECVKLVASPRFADKRLGYLGIMLLLDESQELLTLVINSLKNDLNHTNVYVNGLALSTLGNISSTEMARDLVPEVEKLLGNPSAYVRKKAALCAVKIINKVPDLLENFITRAKGLLQEKNHAVMLTGITLITELCVLSQDAANEFRPHLPQVIRVLRSLLVSGNSPEHDVGGISDPFLQVKLLRLLRVLGKGDAHGSELMGDVLAQIATNTDGSKNVGNSILYESVRTIMNIEADSALRVMAVNILGRFLTNKDNNIRYVALNTLLATVSMDANAVQRHRKTIVECLADTDISIRRRALELSFTLINEGNVRVLVRELLTFLEKADREFRSRIATEISLAAEQYAPNKRWHLDTILRVLRLAGNFVSENILSDFIRLISSTPELHGYAVLKLYTSLREDASQESLILAGVWTIGEFGDILVRNEVVDADSEEQIRVDEKEVIELLESLLRSHSVNTVTREYIINALLKLSARFSQAQDHIRALIAQFNRSVVTELQQRSVEYVALFGLPSIRNALLERMPAAEAKSISRISSAEGGAAAPAPSMTSPSMPAVQQSHAAASSYNDDLLGGLGGPAAAAPSMSSGRPVDDLLSLMDDLPAASAPAASRAPAAAAQANFMDDLLGGLGGPSVASAPAPAPAAAPAPTAAYDKNGLRIQYKSQIDASNPLILNVQVLFSNTSPQPLSGLNFQAAVPKSQQIQLQPLANNNVAAGANTTQTFRVFNPTKAPVRVRVKLNYAVGQQPFEDMTEFGDFPAM